MTNNLKNKAYIGTVWIIGGHGAHQILRLAGNLVLTRLLVPEFFGIMAIAQVFITGLALFSDIGLGPGIIRSRRSSDPAFLNTAWTLQIIRGLILWLLTIIIAYPVAAVYNEPIFIEIIPVIGLTFVFSSFSSTSLHTLNKKIQFGKITFMELVSQVLGLTCMILLAYTYRSVWALIIGSLISTVIRMVWSHFLEKGSRNHFTLEAAAIRELISFGKWIFISTAMMFLASQADRLLLGKLFPLALFGIYNIAVLLAGIPKQIIGKLSNRIIFPLMTYYMDLPRSEFRQKILHERIKLLVPLILLISLVASFGDFLIFFLYDERYQQAGWMLPLLAIGIWPSVLCASIDRCFYAIGKTKIPAAGSFFKFIYMVTILPYMFHSFGVFGGVLAVAMNDLPVYIVNSIGLKIEGLTCFRQDILCTLLLVFLITVFLGARFFLNMGIPVKALFAPG